MIVERVKSGWPAPTLSNAERIEIWRRQYLLVPFEAQIGATAVHALPRSDQFDPSQLPRRESRTLQNVITPPDDVANPPNSAPATVAAAGTFWSRFLAKPELDWVESWWLIGPSLVAVIIALIWRIA